MPYDLQFLHYNKDSCTECSVCPKGGDTVRHAGKMILLFTVAAMMAGTVPYSGCAADNAAETTKYAAEAEHNGHLYRRYDHEMDWDAARDYCASMGGHLITVTDGEEQAVVGQLIENPVFAGYWMGAYVKDSVWHWITDEPFGYTVWSRGEPNDQEEGMCLQVFTRLNSKSGTNGEWDDTWIDGDHGGGIRSQGFICEWEDAASAVIPKESYTVTFKGNSGSPDSQKKAVTFNEKYGTLPVPKRSGYFFAGWYTKKTGGSAITAETVYGQKKNQTLYAHWTKRKSIKSAKISVKSCTYNGNAQTPAVTVKLSGKTLKKGTDYTVSYSNNVSASSKAKVKITGRGKYKDSVSGKFTISRADKKIRLTRTDKEKGKSFTLDVKVSRLDRAASSNSKVATISRGSSGKLTVKIKGAGSATCTAFPESGNYKKITVSVTVTKETLGEGKTDKGNIPMDRVYNAATGLDMNLLKNKVPQALCVAGSYLLVSMYGKDGSSVIVVLDAADYKSMAVLDIRGNTPFSGLDAHVGGITYDGKDSVWVSGGFGTNILKISLERIRQIVAGTDPVRKVYRMTAGQDYMLYSTAYKDAKGKTQHANPSFLAYNKNNGYLYVGNFSKTSGSYMRAFRVNGSSLTYDAKKDISIPEQIQGAVFDSKNGLYLSQSYGAKNMSKIHYYTCKSGKSKYTEKKVTGLKASMSEGLELVNNKLYILFESSAGVYAANAKKADLWQNKIWVLDVNKVK